MKTFEKLSPFIVEKIWGGKKIAKWKNLSGLPQSVGESWEVSCIKGKESRSVNGPLEGLSKDELPYLIKYIDTSANLSIQVHPDDEYALDVEKSSGKTECWVILESEPDAGIYLGFKPGVNKESLVGLIKSKGDISELLNWYPAQRGTFIYVPPGTIHSIGKGVFLMEIQKSSDITYRLWDWNRENSRPLNVAKALDVLNFDPKCNEESFFRFRTNIFLQEKINLVSMKDFIVLSFSLPVGIHHNVTLAKTHRYKSLLLLEGEIILQSDDRETKVEYHQTILIHKTVQRVGIRCLKNSVFIVVC